MKNPECDFCNAGAPCLQGICVMCDGCFGEHCECDPCQHGKPRDVECVFCGRLFEHPGILLEEDVEQLAIALGFGGIPDENQDAVERDAEANTKEHS
jgi:hypothetical protein